jgi:hypothetical protein
MLEFIQWVCWIIMITALGSIAVFLIFEPFLPKKWKTQPMVEKDEASENFEAPPMALENFKGKIIRQVIDTSRWHKRELKVEISEKEMAGILRPEDMHRLVQERTLEWYEELKGEGLTIGAVEYYWDPHRTLSEPNGGELVTVVANVIDVEHARES